MTSYELQYLGTLMPEQWLAITTKSGILYRLQYKCLEVVDKVFVIKTDERTAVIDADCIESVNTIEDADTNLNYESVIHTGAYMPIQEVQKDTAPEEVEEINIEELEQKEPVHHPVEGHPGITFTDYVFSEEEIRQWNKPKYIFVEVPVKKKAVNTSYIPAKPTKRVRRKK